MSSELALNTYILLGNVLNYVVNGPRSDFQVEIEKAADVLTLHHAIAPLKPDEILSAISDLPDKEKALLDRCCRYCLRTLADDELAAKLGLFRDVIEDVLKELSLESAHA
jgi:uncharacterized protein (DUF488 family)